VHERKFLMIKGAKKKTKGHEEKSKGSKRFELSKITDMMMLNQVKKKKTKSSNPTLGGTINHFENKFK